MSERFNDLHVRAATIAEYAHCNDGTTQDDTCEAIKSLVIAQVEAFEHLIQEDSHDKFCETCQAPATRGCWVTNSALSRYRKGEQS